jgi:hypothetical protein
MLMMMIITKSQGLMPFKFSLVANATDSLSITLYYRSNNICVIDIICFGVGFFKLIQG